MKKAAEGGGLAALYIRPKTSKFFSLLTETLRSTFIGFLYESSRFPLENIFVRGQFLDLTQEPHRKPGEKCAAHGASPCPRQERANDGCSDGGPWPRLFRPLSGLHDRLRPIVRDTRHDLRLFARRPRDRGAHDLSRLRTAPA